MAQPNNPKVDLNKSTSKAAPQPSVSATSGNIQSSNDKELQSAYQMQNQDAAAQAQTVASPSAQSSGRAQNNVATRTQTRSMPGQSKKKQEAQGKQQPAGSIQAQQPIAQSTQGQGVQQKIQPTSSNSPQETQGQSVSGVAQQSQPRQDQANQPRQYQTGRGQSAQAVQQSTASQPSPQPTSAAQSPRVNQAQPTQSQGIPANQATQQQSEAQAGTPQAAVQPQKAQPARPKKLTKDKKEKKSFFASLLPGGGSKEDGKKSSKSGISTQKFLKIKGIRNGILELEDGSFKAILMASSVNFSLMSGDEQKAMLYGYQEFLNSLEFPIQIVVQSRIININNYLEKLQEAERMQENDLLKIQISEYREYIKSLVELANITTNRYYVVISYTGSAGSSGKESITDKVKSFINPAREAKVDIESYDKAMQELNLRVSRVAQGLRSMGIRAANLNTQEVVELFYTIYNPELSGSQVLAELERLNIETE